MTYAVIDLGSNSVRLAVYDCEEDKMNKVFTKKEIVGLAGYIEKGMLADEGVQAACVVLNDFRETAEKLVDPANIYLFATASLRNIDNRDEVVDTITRETTLVPDLLEGQEEAALGFAGASRFASCENGIMIDVGGASTELVLFKDFEAVDMISLPIGCLNLSLKYVKDIIPSEKEYRQIKATVSGQISKIEWSDGTKYPLMVGVGGTLRAALKLSHAFFETAPEESAIEAKQIKTLVKLLKTRDNDVYRTLFKFVPERLHTISAGLTILQQVIKEFGCKTIYVSQYGLREGYMIERVLTEGVEHDEIKGNRK